jgi:hypothetical protein
MGNLGAVFPVVHQEKVKVGDVVDDELEEAVGEQVPGLLVGPVADVGVGGKTLELAPEAAIDTTGLPPRLLLPRGGGMGAGEVSGCRRRRDEQEKKAQNPSFCRGWPSRGRRTARAVDERFRTRLMPRACVRCIRLRPATAQTLARKTRAARGCARIRSGSRPARDSAACHCVLPESRRTLTVTLRSLWNLLNLRVRFLTILCLTRGVTC